MPTLPPGSRPSPTASGSPPGAPNVAWFIKDSVAACPAADTLTNSARPSRLRITLYYEDLNCNPKVGVPPESIYVTTQIASGNLKVNDEGAQINADDSTDASGFARVTIPSFSGCGKVRLRLFVSGGSYGTKTATVRTTDVNADGRVSASEIFSPCDLNYDGVSDTYDVLLALNHQDHWHRNALFGTLVRRSSLCDLCLPSSPNTVGAGDINWAQNNRWVAFSARDFNGACKIFVTPADPQNGNASQFTFFNPAAADSDDYNPAWSPLGNEILFDRDDRVIYRKGIKGVNPDTLEHPVLLSAVPVTFVSVSPDAKMIAFTRGGVGFHICMAPITGSPITQLTFGDSTSDILPKWSPDGMKIIFDRRNAFTGARGIYVVSAAPNPPPPTDFFTPDTSVGGAVAPHYAPDGQIVVAGFGKVATSPVPAATLDATSATAPGAVINYPAYKYSTFLSPTVSPDGTRLAELALDPAVPNALTPQVWAARRNMSLPPQFTNIGSHAVADSTPVVSDSPYVGDSLNFTVSATDPEGDPLNYQAFFLQAGMSFAPSTRTFAWRVPGPAGTTYYVKFMVTTPSGGTDVVLDKFAVQACCGPHAPTPAGAIALERVEGPNPTTGQFAAWTGFQPGVTASLSIFDVAGRRVAFVRAPAGRRLVWDGNGTSGSRAPAGIYLYRVEVGTARREGRVVVMR